MKIGILQAGNSPEIVKACHGDYDDLFKSMLKGYNFEFVTYKVFDSHIPSQPNEADGWIVTGSKFGVYEPHAWIPRLEAFLRSAYAVSKPIVGICFGHQILAQALGGTVEKFSGGWSVGATDYLYGTDKHTLIAWHQDQVTAPPKAAEVIGRSDFCPYAMLRYGDKALSFQPHPEFTSDFLKNLLQARRSILPRSIAEDAEASLDRPLNADFYAKEIAEFFIKHRHNS